MAVLPTSAGLLDVLSFGLCSLLDRLFVGNLGPADICSYGKFTPHTLHDDIKVELAHARDDRLTRLRVPFYSKRRIFVGKFPKRNTHFFLVGFGFRLDAKRNNRLRHIYAFQNHGIIWIAERVASLRILHAYGASDVAGSDFFDF